MRISINNGTLVDPANNLEKPLSLHIDDNKIVAIGDAPNGFNAQKQIDASGKLVCPGLVDLCAHSREPGQKHKATIASETKAAASAGITTLCQPPNTQPIIDTPAVAELIRRQAESAGYACVHPIAALTQQLAGKQLSEMAALKEAGCIAVAHLYPIQNLQVLRRSMEYAATFGLTVFLTPQEHHLSANGCAHEGAIATSLGLPGIPAAAETTAVARDIALVEQIGVRAHFLHLSTSRAVQMIGRARYDGHQVSCSVSAHQLHLTEMDTAEFDSNCHVIPPLRTQRDREGLRHGVSTGIISCISSDHQPHEADAKNRPFCVTEPGISGLETLLPLTLKLVEDGVLSLKNAIARLTTGPANILGLDCGTLSIGSNADICIIDPNIEWQFNASEMQSLGHNTPFDGWYFKGRVTQTLYKGTIVFEE